ncbi:zinc finger CCCH domain-containing protein 31 [Oryza brachyantha]|uniref:C3H1-type domain-containing protein n=1 Tax=Oryza brachyantha TaxID=4533 RepID=J3M2E4_ORYBR|nr:zinc finger CCCH domain-containing protein 31 [Oryza brachyantha]
MEGAGATRKRSRPDMANGAAAGGKRSRETESFQTGLSSKSKPCTKFFSTVGCPFGEGCHFSHFVPGGYQAVAKTLNLGPAVPALARAPMDHVAAGNSHSASSGKTRMCTKYNTPEGCKFGDKCHFAHGERELGKPAYMSHESAMAPMGGRFGGRPEPPAPAAMGPPAGNFGASATAKISVDASLAGGIIGKGGVNTKQICRVTGVKLSIRDHESDPNLKNIELEGNFDQIKQASKMVGELIATISASTPTKKPSSAVAPAGRGGPGGRSNYKTKLCENFVKGTCTFGERCHFAHGENEQRKGAA